MGSIWRWEDRGYQSGLIDLVYSESRRCGTTSVTLLNPNACGATSVTGIPCSNARDTTSVTSLLDSDARGTISATLLNSSACDTTSVTGFSRGDYTVSGLISSRVLCWCSDWLWLAGALPVPNAAHVHDMYPIFI